MIDFEYFRCLPYGEHIILLALWGFLPTLFVLQLSFYNLYASLYAKIMQDLSQIPLVLIVDYFSSILWRKGDMVLTQPFGMYSTISLWHEITFPFSVVAWTPLLYGKVISLLNDLSPPA